MGRRAVAFVALLLWGLLAFLTVYVLFTSGPDVLVVISVLVVALLGFGIFGALGE
jgi:hypothetical protein